MTTGIKRWEPENAVFWRRAGKRVAWRNLALSTLALHLNFNVWMMWGIVVAYLPAIGFILSAQQQFLLVSIPPLVGACLRVIYAVAWSWVGGGRWMALTTLSLLAPVLGVAALVQEPGAPFALILLLAAACGLGGAASSSHLSNISFFFPKSAKGLAMGLNAGLGNLGASVVQVVAPLAIAWPLMGEWTGGAQLLGRGLESRAVWLQNAGLIWVPVILLVTWLCWRFADDLPRLRLTPREQWQMLHERHTWRISLLYLSSYGTFIGLSAAFPLLLRKLFPYLDATPYLFIGPALCALVRPLGGWCGDHIGGGVTTLLCNLVMALGTLGMLLTLPGAPGGGHFLPFLSAALLIFLAAGISNGSSYQLSPKVFLIEAGREARAHGQSFAAAYARGGRRGAAAMGVSSVLATLGGFFIPKAFGSSLDWFDSFAPAFYVFLGFYLASMLVAWWHYARPGAPLRC